MITSLLTKIDNTNSATELCCQINILDAIRWITRSWDNTKDTTIRKCFALAGFSPTDNFEDTTTEEEDDFNDNVPLNQVAREFKLSNDDLCFNDNLSNEDDSDDWEKELIASHKQQPDTNESDDDDSTEPETATQEQLSLEETLAAVKKIHQTTQSALSFKKHR